MAALRSEPLNLTLSATNWFCAFVLPLTCTGRPGMSAVIGICFVRPWKTPSISPTSVVSVRRTVVSGESLRF